MQLEETILKRNSTRSFTGQVVDRAVIEEILSLALRSPSWGNTQPWEIVVVGGRTAETLKAEFSERLLGGFQACPDFPMPQVFPGVFNDRYKAVGREVFRLKGIGREDVQARTDHYINNFKGYGAPYLVYLLVNAGLETVYPVFDAGLLAAHICLAAKAKGLGTCLLAALAWYPDIIRKHLNLGEDKKIVIGIALGVPDPDDPVNTLRSERETLDRIVTLKDV